MTRPRVTYRKVHRSYSPHSEEGFPPVQFFILGEKKKGTTTPTSGDILILCISECSRFHGNQYVSYIAYPYGTYLLYHTVRTNRIVATRGHRHGRQFIIHTILRYGEYTNYRYCSSPLKSNGPIRTRRGLVSFSYPPPPPKRPNKCCNQPEGHTDILSLSLLNLPTIW